MENSQLMLLFKMYVYLINNNNNDKEKIGLQSLLKYQWGVELKVTP